MNTRKYLLRLSIVLLAFIPHARAQGGVEPEEPPKYRMELVYIFEAGSTEFIFVIGNAGFKNVASLKNYLSTLPPGSILEWGPGCVRVGGEPLLSSAQEMADFKAFCAERGITFILVPSG